MFAIFRHNTPRTRGAVLLEFLFVAPLILVITFFTVDMGRAIYLKTNVADATQSAARIAAQRGGANVGGRPVAQQAFNAYVDTNPALKPSEVASFTAWPARCTNTNPNITARSLYTITFLTPGIDPLMRYITGGGLGMGRGITVESRAVERCEITWRN